MAEAPRSQLRMALQSLDQLPEVDLPAGYSPARLRMGEVEPWIAVLNSAGTLGTWDRERAERVVAGAPARVVQEGIHLLWRGPEPVATACLTHHGDTPEAELGWVAVSPAHRGRSLGRQICLVTLNYIRDQGYPSVFLLTDDQRLAAIRVYWGIGFRPRLADADHEGRWRDLTAALSLAWDGGG